MSERLSDAARDATLLDLDGNEVAMRALWEEKTAVLVFLRHFG